MGWFKPSQGTPAPLRTITFAIPYTPGAAITLSGAYPSYPNGFRKTVTTGSSGDVSVQVPGDASVINLQVEAKGYKPYLPVLQLPKGITTFVIGKWPGPIPPTWVELPGLVPDRPQPVARGPLPPITFPGTYVKELPWTPPQTRDYLRMDAWGVTIQGAPFVPGLDPRKTECLLTWFIDRYTPEWQDRWLKTYAERGYTHFLLSAADSMGPPNNPGKTPGAGQTLEQFVATCLKVKQVIPYVVVALGSKDFQPAHMTAAEWQAYVDPIMDALIAAKAVDEFIPSWEHDLWNTPGRPTIDFFRHVGTRAHAAGLSCWMHFSVHYTSWFADGDPRGRFGFYDDLAGGGVDGIMYQADENWDIEMLQARTVDSLWHFGTRGNDFKFRVFEIDANKKFARSTPTEDDSNLIGFLSVCTVDNVKQTDARVWGFGGGARMLDGKVI